ncbi:DUF2812 domain-containing protein [Pseudoflavonifractor sp. P01025]|uniref:DUF2812 domain-containing protein n=1 Tax=Eubacteriales TaxID=186802 RepID=UPI001ADF237B|nr:DUF2812 domain-containing protein [Flavonifractor sp. AGMB03687]
MSKRCYRFFGGLLRTQTNWLNKMASEGFRLVRTGKLLYEFESCEPNKYEYCLEFIGEKSQQGAEEYKKFLEDIGYHVFYKNINLNYSIGKVRVRPWAEKGGRIATNSTTFNKELLIVEKVKDGKPFELHTTNEDRAQYIKQLRNPWLSFGLIFLVCGFLMKSIILAILAVASLIPVILYQVEISKLEKDAITRE